MHLFCEGFWGLVFPAFLGSFADRERFFELVDCLCCFGTVLPKGRLARVWVLLRLAIWRLCGVWWLSGGFVVSPRIFILFFLLFGASVAPLGGCCSTGQCISGDSVEFWSGSGLLGCLCLIRNIGDRKWSFFREATGFEVLVLGQFTMLGERVVSFLLYVSSL